MNSLRSQVKAVDVDGQGSFDAHILRQTASTRYLVINLETGVEAEVERSMMEALPRLQQDARAHRGPNMGAYGFIRI